MTIFGYKTRKEKQAELEAQQKREKQSAICNALIQGLDEMDKTELSRVVLTLYESQPDENATGRWLDMGKDTDYYPFEFLDEEEQALISSGKHYTAIALVRKNVNGFVEYPSRGVEISSRTHIHPFLPQLKPESRLLYVTKTGVYNKSQIFDFSETALKSGWTPEMINQIVAREIQRPRKPVERRRIDTYGFKELSNSLEI